MLAITRHCFKLGQPIAVSPARHYYVLYGLETVTTPLLYVVINSALTVQIKRVSLYSSSTSVFEAGGKGAVTSSCQAGPLHPECHRQPSCSSLSSACVSKPSTLMSTKPSAHYACLHLLQLSQRLHQPQRHRPSPTLHLHHWATSPVCFHHQSIVPLQLLHPTLHPPSRT